MKYAEERLGGLVGTEDFGYQYSPEIFTQSDTDFALSVCEAVSDVWQPEAGREIILNLPATVEMSTPNTYADQIEWFARGLPGASTPRSACTRTTTAAPPSRPPSWP